MSHKRSQAETSTTTFKLESLTSMGLGVKSNNPQIQLEATTQFRKILEQDTACTDQIIATEILPLLVDFIRNHSFAALQFEAVRLLSMISSVAPHHAKTLCDYHAVEPLVELLNSNNEDIVEQAIWALGRVAMENRDDVIRCDKVVEKILVHITTCAKLSMLISSSFTLRYLCSNEAPELLVKTKQAFPTLRRLLQSKEPKVISNACWAICRLTESREEGTTDDIQALIDAGVCHRLSDLLKHSLISVLLPVLRTTCNIICMDDRHLQTMIDAQLLPKVLELLKDKSKTHKIIQKRACSVILSITVAGTGFQIQAVIEANIIPVLVQIVQTADDDTKNVAARAICHAISRGSKEQIKSLVDQGCITVLCNLLDNKDPKLVSVCIEQLGNVLKAGEVEGQQNRGRNNHYLGYIYDAGGHDKLENMQSHTQNCTRAIEILRKYPINKMMARRR